MSRYSTIGVESTCNSKSVPVGHVMFRSDTRMMSDIKATRKQKFAIKKQICQLNKSTVR